MKSLKLLFYAKLFIYLMCNSSTFADDDSLSGLLQDRETRLKGYILLRATGWKIDIFKLIDQLIYYSDFNAKDQDIPQHSLISTVYVVFANNSWNYRREAYQLIRDLEIEISPNYSDYVPCIKAVYDYNAATRYDTHGLVSVIHRLGNCLNLDCVDENGKRVEQVDDKLEQIGRSQFIYSMSPSPIVQRIRRILNAILKLVAHIGDDKEFAVGKTEWYGEVSESNNQKWKILANYFLVERELANDVLFVPVETDDDERSALLDERRLRFIQRKDDIVNAQFNLYLEQINNLLDDISLQKTPDLSQITFPHLTLPSEKSSAQLEMYELVKDLIVELGSTVYSKNSSLTVDFRGIKHAHQAFTNDFMDIRDSSFKSKLYGEMRLWAKLLNLTYADSEGRPMLQPETYTRGKYIFPFNSTESRASRRLRHIINAFERFYFDTYEERYRGGPFLMKHMKNYTYEWIGNFTDDEFPAGLEDKSQYENYIKYRGTPLLQNLIRLIFMSSLDSLERFLTKYERPDHLMLIVEGKNHLINYSAEIRAKIYKHIGYLYIQGDNLNTEQHLHRQMEPKSLKTSPTSVCQDDNTTCRAFLRLLQLTGGEFQLKYVDEYGEEIPLDSAFSGTFVGLPSDSWQISRVRGAAKYHFNAIVHLLSAEKNK